MDLWLRKISLWTFKVCVWVPLVYRYRRWPFLDQTATIFVLNAKEAGSAAAALFSPNVDSDRSITMAIISALELWCVTLHSLSCVLTQSRLPVLQPAVLQRQSVIESRVKIASRKLFSVAILYRGGVGCTDESRAPDLTISRSETPPPEAKFFVCVGEYQHEQGTPAGGFTTGTASGLV